MPRAATATSTRVSSIMSRDLITFVSGTSAGSVAETMISRGLSRAPVVDEGGRMIGMISKSDFVERSQDESVEETPGLERGTHIYGEPRDVDAIMTPAVTSISEQATVQRAAELMASAHLHGLPVVSAEGKPVGFISSMDVLAWLAGLR